MGQLVRSPGVSEEGRSYHQGEQTLTSSGPRMCHKWAKPNIKTDVRWCREHSPWRQSWHYSCPAQHCHSEPWDRCCQSSWSLLLFLRAGSIIIFWELGLLLFFESEVRYFFKNICTITRVYKSTKFSLTPLRLETTKLKSLVLQQENSIPDIYQSHTIITRQNPDQNINFTPPEYSPTIMVMSFPVYQICGWKHRRAKITNSSMKKQ